MHFRRLSQLKQLIVNLVLHYQTYQIKTNKIRKFRMSKISLNILKMLL